MATARLSVILCLLLAGCGSGSPDGSDAAAKATGGVKYDLLVEWGLVTGATRYYVYKDTNCSQTGPLTALLATVQQPTTFFPRYEDKFGGNPRQVCYEVSAVDSNGIESAHSPRVTGVLR